jgi:hypothetical protein
MHVQFVLLQSHPTCPAAGHQSMTPEAADLKSLHIDS